VRFLHTLHCSEEVHSAVIFQLAKTGYCQLHRWTSLVKSVVAVTSKCPTGTNRTGINLKYITEQNRKIGKWVIWDGNMGRRREGVDNGSGGVEKQTTVCNHLLTNLKVHLWSVSYWANAKSAQNTAPPYVQFGCLTIGRSRRPYWQGQPLPFPLLHSVLPPPSLSSTYRCQIVLFFSGCKSSPPFTSLPFVPSLCFSCPFPAVKCPPSPCRGFGSAVFFF